MVGFHSFLTTCLLAASLTPTSLAAPSRHSVGAGSLVSPPGRGKRETAALGDKLVFCHFMMGIVSGRTSASDYDADMQVARDMGIDAFALNIGTDEFTNAQLGYAYESAANNDMKVFISFDFNWFDPSSDAQRVGEIIANYSSQTAQLMVDDKVVVSSFTGDGLDVPAMRSAAGVDVFFAPNFHPTQSDTESLDAALNWMGWANNGENKAPQPGGVNITVLDGDSSYKDWLSGMPYISPVSPWFSTHYGAEVSYSKNFVFPSGLLWFERWNQILTERPHYVEIVTFNDYGESHYIGPLSSPHYDDGASKWVNDMPHDGFRDLAKPFIAAYKAGATSPDAYITEDKIVYWYRPTRSDVDCDATDNTMGEASNSSGNYFHGKPNGYDDLEDSVFVATLLTADATLSVTSGGVTHVFEAKKGANAFSVPMSVGQQGFSLVRDSETVLSGVSLKDVQDECICGIYNFNCYVGTLPEAQVGALDADGLMSFTVGLSVTTCSAIPSLSTPAGYADPTTTTTTAGADSPTETASELSPSQTIATTASPTTSAGASLPFTLSTSTITRGHSSTSRPQQTQHASSTPKASQTQPSAAPTATATASCNGGTVAEGQSGNLLGLCDFACSHGFCPSIWCTCTSTGPTQTYMAGDGSDGCALEGEDTAYDALCAFSCGLGYCPDTACSTSC